MRCRSVRPSPCSSWSRISRASAGVPPLVTAGGGGRSSESLCECDSELDDATPSSSCAASDEEMLCSCRLCMLPPQPVLLRRAPLWLAAETTEAGDTERDSACELPPSLSDMTVESCELHWC